MRVTILSVLLAVMPMFGAYSDARLPVVNVGSGGVSARSAFGEDVVSRAAVVVEPVKTARRSVTTRPVTQGADILVPQKPSDDLWARTSEKPLRLPEADEVKVVSNENLLPEEFVGVPSLDAEIEKMVARKRTAEVVKPVPLVEEKTIVARAPTRIENREPVARIEAQQRIAAPQPIKVSRAVIPMDNVPEPVVNVVMPGEAPKPSNNDFAKLSPTQLKQAFKKTYMSENKHLSTYKIDDRFDVASDFETQTIGFEATPDLSESGGIRPLEVRIGFRGEDSSLSRDTFNLLNEYAGIVGNNPKRAVQISIPEEMTRSFDDRKLTARRLAIVEQVLRDSGVSDYRIIPVLSGRTDESFVLRIISNDQMQTLTHQKRDIFGDTVSKKTYKSMSW